MASSKFPVAVIGIGLRLPGASNSEEFWEMMMNGRDTVGEFPEQRADDIDHVVSSFRGQLVNEEKPFFTGSFFDSVDKFDPGLFQINHKEAYFIEPEQRFFLEVVWELLEDAGYASKIRGSNTGVYVGNTVNKYKYILNENHPSISHGNHSPFISSRVSYTHDLHGPAMMVATGCSSSLLAVHLACQGLLSGDCDMAIAGGITLDLLPISAKTDIWNQLGITGPNVKCRAFDASAKGIAKGEGCGVVLLKALHQAVEDGDHIYGILEATTANQDGHSNGITAPHPVAQANMLNQAWRLANIKPDLLGFFEAHGTGTELGDPIEISGITNAFKMSGVKGYLEEDRKIPIGSVKANIGHLADGAAGIIGLIKAILCMNKNKIPGAINFDKPNPHINWKKAPVYVNTSPVDWFSQKSAPRFASVSAFGLLGTNIHAVVKEYQRKDNTEIKHDNERKPQILCFAANSTKSLKTFCGKMYKYFNTCEDRCQTHLRNVCYSINQGREQPRFQYKVVVIANTWEEMTESLNQIHQALAYNSFDSIGLQEQNIIVSFNGEYKINTAQFSNGAVNEFIKGKKVMWQDYYHDKDHLEIVPQLPTYAFDHIRLWPDMSSPINKELLQLEHKTGRSNYHGYLEECRETEQVHSKTGATSSHLEEREDKDNSKETNIENLLSSTLNSSLNTQYNWEEMRDENLFILGMDSLILTQVNMILKDKTGLNLSMSEFRRNPTFSGLLSIYQERRVPQVYEETPRNAKLYLDTDVESLLRNALNAAMGSVIDWKNNIHTNLFTLGLDSLIYTQVNMALKESTKLETPITMAELHENPNVYNLCKILSTKIQVSINTTDHSDEHHSKNKIDKSIPGNDSQICTNTESCTTYPISFAQRRLWVMQELVTNPCAYNATNCLKITGDFHPVAFITAVNQVLSNNAAFYTVIEDGETGPVQRHDWKLNIEIHDEELSQYGASAEDRAMSLYNEDYRTPFVLSQGPLVRCKLYRLSNNMYYYTMVIHHIIFDGWSHFVFYNELWNAYNDITQGKPIVTAMKRPFYTDIAQEEHKMSLLKESKLAKDMEYWMKNLSGDLPFTTFPGDRKRPPVFTYNGRRITRFIGHDVVDGLARFSESQHTMFMTLLSAVYSLLKRYTGETDFIIGTPIAGRYDARSSDTIGCFINTLALRVKLEDNLSFREILQEVSEVCLKAYDHQQAPFDHLVGQLNLPRDTSITPVFSINVCYHNTERKGDHVEPPEEISVERKLLHNDSSKWDMQFDFLHERQGMRFTLEYYSDVFSDNYATCVVDNFLALLNSVVETPMTPVEQLCLKATEDTAEEHFQKSIMIGPTVDLGNKALPELLLGSITENKNSLAIEDQKSFTYEELMVNIRNLSSFIIGECKLKKGARVGILMDNSTRTIESIVACIMTQLVYVPLDVNSPNSRLEHICNEANVQALLFSSAYVVNANHLQWTCPSLRSIVCVDAQVFNDIKEEGKSPLMDTELWDCVATKAVDEIEGGGWMSSYTGEHMSLTEMEEYSNNVLHKLKPFLKPSSAVLEIGCASGLTTRVIKPNVGSYVATDLSEKMVEKISEVFANDKSFETHCAAADEVFSKCKHRKFDVIIINSVIHCFPGHNYLRKVLRDCENLLSEDGIIFLGDLMDLDLRDKLVASMTSFKASYPDHRVKTSWTNELFIPRKFLDNFCSSSTVLKSAKHSRKMYTVPNELTEFRFDSILSKREGNITDDLEYRTFALEDIANCAYKADMEDLVKDISFEDEAYILYTSGTTGTPKGVVISHGALLNYTQWAAKTYGFNTSTTTPFFAPITFDFTITSIFPPLLKGSNIRIYKNFQDTYQQMSQNNDLTIGKFAPMQLEMILSSQNRPLSIRTYILGGEKLTPKLLDLLKQNQGGNSFHVWNEYGPTEATVGCVVRCYTSEELPLSTSSLVAIGHPIDNTTVGVVRNNHLVSIGFKGQLAIGGRGLCSHFVGRGKNTKAAELKAFCNGLWGSPVDRMLLTEDIVEVLPNTKEMAYFGREESDTTKVNGVRIDISEVQKAIEKIYFIKSAWVCSFKFDGHNYLGAAVEIEKQTVTSTDWKMVIIEDLKQHLPIRTIPKVFFKVSKPPTNNNGKRDTKSIREQCILEMQALSHKHLNSESKEEQSSRMPLLNKLQKIWHSILPVNYLPRPDQNFFFDLSGDSLQAIHLVRKMRDEGFKVSVTDIFQNPTIEKLMGILTTLDEQVVIQEEEEVPFKPTPIVEDFFLKGKNFPDYFALSALLNFHDRIESSVLRKALRSVMKKHGSLRSQLYEEDGHVWQKVVPLKKDQPIVMEIDFERQEKHLSDEKDFKEMCEKLDRSHSLKDGKLVGAAIFNTSHPNEGMKHYALLVVHHAALDIVSWQQIVEDLASAMKLLSKDETKEPNLKPCQLTFRSYCEAVHAESSGIFSPEVNYWTEVEKHCNEAGVLVDKDIQSKFKTAKWYSKSMDASALRATSTGMGCTDEQVLLTAFGRSMSCLHGKDETALCIESHGRQLDIDSSDTVGWCTSMFPFVLNTPLKDDMVAQVKTVGVDLKAIPNHGLGFGLLKSAGKVSMDYPKVTFIFQGSLDASAKETLDGGKYKFDHIPWIEIMLNELRNRRFHRHEDELLEFDLEFIAWIHSGELKFGCLFDEETISQATVEEIVKHAEINLNTLAKHVASIPKDVNIRLIPGITITPECEEVIKDSLRHHNINVRDIDASAPDEFVQALIQPTTKQADLTVVIPRIKQKEEENEFQRVLKPFLEMNKKKVIFLNVDGLSNTQKLPKLSEEATVVKSIVNKNHYDPVADEEYNMPLSRKGYFKLGLDIARYTKAFLIPTTYKVIAVDGDYTLWNGECAQGQVSLNQGNIALQNYLLNMKNKGYLIVLLSKNEIQDVLDVFAHPPEKMILKREDFVSMAVNWDKKHRNIEQLSRVLNLGLDSFVFIDDNVLECEEMLRNSPSILTLLYPSDPSMVCLFLDSLWILDTMKTTEESSSRTQLYQSEIARQEEIECNGSSRTHNNNIDLMRVLRGWQMEIQITELKVNELKQNDHIMKRVAELLHRTNQFKLNDVHTDIANMPDDNHVWVISLKDSRGKYGIISVVILEDIYEEIMQIKQWVISCRALSRYVEHRLLHELQSSFRCGLNIRAKVTKRNTPILTFLESIIPNFEPSTELKTYHIERHSNVDKSLHKISKGHIEDLGTSIKESFASGPTHVIVQKDTDVDHLKIAAFISEAWTPILCNQASKYQMYPLIPSPVVSEQLPISNGKLEETLNQAWMEALNTSSPPDENSNFIREGGTSFKAVFLVARLRKEQNISLSIVDLLSNPDFVIFKQLVLNAEKLENSEFKILEDDAEDSRITAAQERMLLMQESAPKSTAYVESIVVPSEQPFSTKALFSRLLEVHPILTARIRLSKDQRTHIISSGNEINTDVQCEEVKSRNVVEYISSTIPEIEVLSAPLVVFRRISTEQRHYIVVHIHHIICDDVTLNSIKSTITMMSDPLAVIPVQINNLFQYIRYEEEYKTSRAFEEDAKFWAETYSVLPEDSTLSDLPESQATFTDFKAFQAKHMMVEIPKETLEEAISNLATTDFQYFLSCSTIILQQYLGTKDIAVAIPVTNRTPKFENTDGLFVNTVIPKFNVNWGATFAENIKYISSTLLQTMKHSQFPLDELSRHLWKENKQSFGSFCSVMINYLRNQGDCLLKVPSKHAKGPLCIDFIEDVTNRKLVVWVEWAADIISEEKVKRLTEGIIELMNKGLKSLQKELSEIQCLSKVEQRLIESFTRQSSEIEHDNTPCGNSFEKHVKTHGDHIAVICDNRRLTYREIDTGAYHIAEGILNVVDPILLTVRPVVVLMEKSEKAIMSILGIWKAGGHFLPVSLSNKSTMRDVFARANPSLILSSISPSDLEKEFGTPNCPVYFIDDLPRGNNEITMTRSVNDLAYIIRTSGSTGTPKQCKITHRSLQTMASAWRKAYNMTEYQVSLLQWAPLSFDVFVGDIVRALIAVPGTLVICPDERRLDIPYILNLIRAQNVSIAEVTPQFGQQLAENDTNGELQSLQILILGSDVVKKQLFTKLKCRLQNHQRLINSYGMTEATIDSAFFEGEPPLTKSGTVPIGKPYPGVNLHILNPKSLLPCPVGTIGELYISGNVLASGDVEIASVCGTEMLKTGDSARWLPTGDIELLGRLDNMMKLRGFRISTTEIENKILAKSSKIRSVCVLPVTNENDVEFLCAFLVLDEDNESSTIKSNLLQQLKSDLPYYMIPDIVHVVDDLPLTPNGKVDTKALPKLADLFRSQETRCSPDFTSSSSVISTLISLFAETMTLPSKADVNIEQTFMEQGAHSLILLRFYSTISQQTDYQISIADLFSYPTIQTLAAHIQSTKSSVSQKDTEEEETVGRGSGDIAITGVGMRLPGGTTSMSELWKILNNGEDLIKEFPANRREDVIKCMEATKAETLEECDTFKGSFLDSIDQFDHQFFKIAPGEAKYMSPEQRLFLQVATEALNEGRTLSNINGSKVGVFVGNSEIGYSELDQPDEAISISGLMPGMIATRVAYQFNLKGPTMMVDTACSSSLMALKLACESIQNGECDGALVGGVNLVLYPARTGVFGETGILSPDFHCRAFDRDATGTAVGEGVMCIYVESLESAKKKSKPIYGVVKAVASNSVGHGNGITAPTSSSQVKVIEAALKQSHLQPADISFVEAHGTGTKLGDRIELSALSSVFSKDKGVKNITIGSTKSTFGHLDSAAGMIGVFKVLATMLYKQIPPISHFEKPHPELANSVLSVSTKSTPLQVQESQNFTAGISSFGLTGTNCHAVITHRIIERVTTEPGTSLPLLLAGKDFKQIKNQVTHYLSFIQENIIKTRTSNITELCVTIARRLNDIFQTNMGNFSLRMVVHIRNGDQAIKTLQLVQKCQNMEEVNKLASVRSDIFVSTSKSSNSIGRFISEGAMQMNELFEDVSVDEFTAPGVYVDLFSPTRHWLDASSSKRLKQIGLLEILEHKLGDAREMVRSLPLAASSELRELERKFCVAVIIKLLMQTKVSNYLVKSSVVSLSGIFKETGMLAKYDKLFYVMVRELYDNHLIEAMGDDASIHCLDRFTFQCSHVLDSNPDDIAAYAMGKYPAWSDCFRFPLYCSQYLTKVLWGKMSPLSVIYPQGDLNYMYQFNRLGDLIGDVYYNMYMQLIGEYAKQLSMQGKKVRILEVGAGMGHVTRQLIPKLKDVPNIEYWFTDLGKAFVENAKTLFEEYLHMMKFSTFDITKSAPKQGLLGSYDIIISYNVIHTTESVMASVTNLKSCLGEDGTLFIIESAKNETWATLAWGILDGWWYFKDYDLRPDEPMLEPEKWEKVLKGSGFGSVHSCPVDEFERDQVEKFLFVCSAKPLKGQLQQLPGWWEKIDLQTRRHQDLEDSVRVDIETEVGDSPVERKAVHDELKQIWCELFDIDDIKPEDEFNSLGGESLLAIQMMTMVRKRIGYQLEIADTFGYPSLGGLADFIADNLEMDDEDRESEQTEEWSNISSPKNLSDFEESEGQSTLLMFPGQGSQKSGMCVSMKDSSAARRIFQVAEGILGYNILDLFLENGPEVVEKLKSTEFVQVALLVGCLAKIEQIKAENSDTLKHVTHVAGLSVGEFAALVYADVLTIEDALKIVQVRGRAMENEVKRSSTGMVSVFGPKTEQLQQFLDAHFPDVKISTYLADNQHTLAGTEDEVSELVDVLAGEMKTEMGIIDVRKLRVAGAFHSRFMERASQVVDPVIHGVTFKKPRIPLIMNVSGDIVEEPEQIKKLLCEQLVAPVMWKESVITGVNSGVKHFLEVAPARVLSSIVRNRIAAVKNCSVDLVVV